MRLIFLLNAILFTLAAFFTGDPIFGIEACLWFIASEIRRLGEIAGAAEDDAEEGQAREAGIAAPAMVEAGETSPFTT